MRTVWHEIWGCAQGPVRRFAPQTRIMLGMIVFAACMIGPVNTWWGVTLLLSITFAWIWICRPRRQQMQRTLLLGFAILLPYFLFVPWMLDGSWTSETFGRAMLVSWALFFRGLCGMQTAMATVASLTASELRQGMLCLPVPYVISAILLAIIHQTSTLIYETSNMVSAIAVRGACGRFGSTLRLIRAIPTVWLPRVMIRAERVAAAMEVRQWNEQDVRSMGNQKSAHFLDAFVLALAVLLFLFLCALRWWGFP